MTSHLDLNTLTLHAGGHRNRGDGVCLLEAVAWWAHEPHTDRPRCVSPVLGAFGRRLNDWLPDPKRQELIPLIPMLPGTAGDGQDEARAYLAADWAIRTAAPRWLDFAGLTDLAASLRELTPVTASTGAQARQIAREVRSKTWAARSAAYEKLRVRARTAADAAAAAAADAAAAVADAAAAVAAAVAVAVADAAVAVAVADAVADAAVAVADAVADAVAAVAAAVAAVVADADAAVAAADAADWDSIYRTVYNQVRKAANDALRPQAERYQDSAIELYRRMIRPQVPSHDA